MDSLNKPLFIYYKTPNSSQIQNNFHQFTNKYNFIKSQTNPNMYKSYIHTTNLYEKCYKTSKHPNKIRILQKYTIYKN
jgi:hypothetical protein